MPTPKDFASPQFVAETAAIASAYIGTHATELTDLSTIIRTIHSTICSLGQPEPEGATAGKAPAVPIKKSITPDFIICLEDGKKLKMLKRYLRSNYDLTPEQYRQRWNLPADYPMVAPNYANVRSAFAKKIGLGRGATR